MLKAYLHDQFQWSFIDIHSLQDTLGRLGEQDLKRERSALLSYNFHESWWDSMTVKVT